jgi:hypothetical protein
MTIWRFVPKARRSASADIQATMWSPGDPDSHANVLMVARMADKHAELIPVTSQRAGEVLLIIWQRGQEVRRVEWLALEAGDWLCCSGNGWLCTSTGEDLATWYQEAGS